MKIFIIWIKYIHEDHIDNNSVLALNSQYTITLSTIGQYIWFNKVSVGYN